MSWTAEGGLSRGDTDADFKRACFYDNLEPEFILSELFWTALILDKFRGKGYSHQIMETILGRGYKNKSYATVREENIPMQKCLIKYGFMKIGHPWNSTRGEYQIILFENSN